MVRYSTHAEDPMNQPRSYRFIAMRGGWIPAVRCRCGETEDLKLVGGKGGEFFCPKHR